MTGNNILLDTNIVIDLFRGDKKILNTIEEHEQVFLPVAVLAELYLGANRSKNQQKKTQEIQDFLKKCILLNADQYTAENFALIKAALLNKGKPIPENDIWIAAAATQTISLYK